MYSADGIDLTQTEFNELKFVLSCGERSAEMVQQRTQETPGLDNAYKKLQGYGLVTCNHVGGFAVIKCEPTIYAPDWVASYEKSIADEKAEKRREWKKVAVNIGGAAIAGGIMSLIVTLVLHFCFNL